MACSGPRQDRIGIILRGTQKFVQISSLLTWAIAWDSTVGRPFTVECGSFQSQVSQKPSLHDKNLFEISPLNTGYRAEPTVGCLFLR